MITKEITMLRRKVLGELAAGGPMALAEIKAEYGQSAYRTMSDLVVLGYVDYVERIRGYAITPDGMTALKEGSRWTT